jgi:hypothetical protein
MLKKSKLIQIYTMTNNIIKVLKKEIRENLQTYF